MLDEHGIAVERKIRIISKEEIAQGAIELRMEAEDGGLLPVWTPGAHVDLKLPYGIERQYSLCGDTEDRSTYRIAVLREPESRGGSSFIYSTKLRVGDVHSLRGPRNHFELVDAPGYLFIAGGIGITPILPMIRAAERRGRRWRLLYGGRTIGSMAFLDELAVYGDDVSVRPQDECGLLNLEEAIKGLESGDLVYCCGPTPLLDAVVAAGAELPAGTVHIERFAPGQPADTSADTAFDVVLAKSNRTLTIPADQSILGVLQAHGLPVEFSCEEGTCGTCEQKVLGGVPDHRDFVLDDGEKESNEVMMICVSRSKSRELVLDL